MTEIMAAAIAAVLSTNGGGTAGGGADHGGNRISTSELQQVGRLKNQVTLQAFSWRCAPWRSACSCESKLDLLILTEAFAMAWL